MLETQLLESMDAWLSEKPGYATAHRMWWHHWLGPECILLRYARERQGRIGEDIAEKLDQLLQDGALRQVQIHYQRLDNRRLEQQATRILTGLVHGVQAARHLARWREEGGDDPLEALTDAALGCIEAYQEAWPLSEVPTQPAHLLAPGGQTDHIGTALNSLLGRQEITTSGFLVFRRILEYIFGIDGISEESRSTREGKPFRIGASILLCRDADGTRPASGHVGHLEIRTVHEQTAGFYLDPVALGLTVIDWSMVHSLKTAWRLCQEDPGEAPSVLIDPETGAPRAIRLSPNLPHVPCLTGESAGAMFACGIFAAAKGMELDTDASASAVVDADHLGTLKKVSEDSIRLKLVAAESAHIRRVVLELGQAQRFQHVAGVRVYGAATIAEAFDLLTGNACIDRVLDNYSEQKCQQWDHARSNPEDRDKLTHYIEPHYSALAEGARDPFDHSSLMPRQPKSEQDQPKDPYERIAGEEEEALHNLLQLSNRLCVSEDAGVGKTIFTRRAQAFLSSEPGQELLADGKPLLAVRWEGEEWPMDVAAELAKELRPLIQEFGGGLEPQEVADRIIQEGRVVLILDALDQVPEEYPFKRLIRFLDNEGQHCRVILTSRSFAVRHADALFAGRRWRFTRIDGFDEQQQEQYLGGLIQSIPHRWVLADLLRIPVVLSMIRELAEDGELPLLKSRGDAYFQVSRQLIYRAAKKTECQFDEDEDIPRLQEILAATAFEMMHRKCYDYTVRGKDVRKIHQGASKRCSSPIQRPEWELVKHATDLTDRCILEGATSQVLGWKHRGMMEFYCGMHLARFAQPQCQEDAAPFANDEQWYWAWRFAIELPDEAFEDEETEGVIRRDSLALLYASPRSGPRPTEFIYRSWPLMEQLNEESGLVEKHHAVQLFQGELFEHAQKGNLLAKAIVVEEDANEYFARCPKDLAADGKPFMMGAPEEEEDAPFEREHPPHPVRVTPFLLAKYTVTNALYELFDRTHQAHRQHISEDAQTDDHPVVNVNWYDAWVFCKWLSGWKKCRLPTEAEWEYACRAGTTTPYCFGESLTWEQANIFHGSSETGHTVPVKSYEPNAWGLYQMHGNVWEWCEDGPRDYPVQTPAADTEPLVDPKGPDSASSDRVLRGGCWNDWDDNCRSAQRFSYDPSHAHPYHGFRVCCVD